MGEYTMTPIELWLYWTGTNDEAPPMSIAETIAHSINEAVRHGGRYVGIDDKGYIHMTPQAGRYTVYSHGKLRRLSACMLLAFARRCRYGASHEERVWAERMRVRYGIRKWRRTWQ